MFSGVIEHTGLLVYICNSEMNELFIKYQVEI